MRVLILLLFSGVLIAGPKWRLFDSGEAWDDIPEHLSEISEIRARWALARWREFVRRKQAARLVVTAAAAATQRTGEAVLQSPLTHAYQIIGVGVAAVTIFLVAQKRR